MEGLRGQHQAAEQRHRREEDLLNDKLEEAGRESRQMNQVRAIGLGLGSGWG